MNKSFKFYIPLQKNTISTDELVGIASTVSIDRDEERMSDNALQQMQQAIKTIGVNLFGNHQHDWENTLGFISDSQVVDRQLKIKVKLDNPDTNPKIPMLLNKLERGIKLGLSVGGNVTKDKYEYDKAAGKKVKVIDGVNLYEVSVVGIPSNADSYVSLPDAIFKSIKEKNIYAEDEKCGYCGHLESLHISEGEGKFECTKCDCNKLVKATQEEMESLGRFANRNTCDNCGKLIGTGDKEGEKTGLCTECRSKDTSKCPLCFGMMKSGECGMCLYKSHEGQDDICRCGHEQGAHDIDGCGECDCKKFRQEAEKSAECPLCLYVHT